MVFELIDSRHDPQQIDLDFINSLGQSGIPLGLVFTKADKNGVTKAQSSVAKFKRTLKKEWEELPPDFLTSTVSGFGKDELIQYIRDVNVGLSQH